LNADEEEDVDAPGRRGDKPAMLSLSTLPFVLPRDEDADTDPLPERFMREVGVVGAAPPASSSPERGLASIWAAGFFCFGLGLVFSLANSAKCFCTVFAMKSNKGYVG
jgi:hypothetical protein